LKKEHGTFCILEKNYLGVKLSLVPFGYCLTGLVIMSSCKSDDDLIPIDYSQTSPLWKVDIHDVPSLPALRDVFFSSYNNGYAVGNAGTIIKTVNSGETWDVINKYDFIDAVTELMLTTVHFIDDKIGFIGSSEKRCCFGEELNLGSVFLTTTNGGESWDKKYFPDIKEFYEIIFFDAMTGLALANVDESGNSVRKILRTTDGGQDWQPISIPGINGIATYELNARPNIFPVIGINSIGVKVLLVSNDNGQSWKIKDLPAAECNRVYFYDTNVGFVSCGNQVFKTTNGGTTWDFMPGSPFNLFSVVHFNSEDEGIIINGHYHFEVSHGEGWDILDYYDIYETQDGGQEWLITMAPKELALEGNYFMWDNENFCLLKSDFIRFELK